MVVAHQDNVLNATNPAAMAAYAAGGTPFSPQYMPYNSPFLAQCSNSAMFSCTAEARAALTYVSYKATPKLGLVWKEAATEAALLRDKLYGCSDRLRPICRYRHAGLLRAGRS